MSSGFLTVAQAAQAEIIERKSRFIGYVSPVATEAEAVAFIKTIKTRHHDATHNCYAYQIGEHNQFQRSSDDGEPAGTAGRPILEVIKKNDLKNVVVVVTRYFGGILLGAGGLVRAYSKAAQEGLKAARIVEQIPAALLSVTLDYGLWGKLENYLQQSELATKDVLYMEQVTALVPVPFAELERFRADLMELGNGSIKLLELAENSFLTKTWSGSV